jgi:hypothetical protein
MPPPQRQPSRAQTVWRNEKKFQKTAKEMRKRFTSAGNMLLMRSVLCAYERILLLL